MKTGAWLEENVINSKNPPPPGLGGGGSGGTAGSNGKGGGAENFNSSTGQAATTYGSGGGGAGSSGIGGKGANGVVVLYFANTGYSLPSIESLKPAITAAPKVSTLPPYRIYLSCRGKSGKETITISTNKGKLETLTLPKTNNIEKNYYFNERPVYVLIDYTNDATDSDVYVSRLEMNGTNLLTTYYNTNTKKQNEVRNGNLFWGQMTYQFDVPTLTKNTLTIKYSGRLGTERFSVTTNRGLWNTFTAPETPGTLTQTKQDDFALTSSEIYVVKPVDPRGLEVYLKQLEYNGTNLLSLYTNTNATVQKDVRSGKLSTPGTNYIFDTGV